MILLYPLTIFLGAGLLFAVQPLVGRLREQPGTGVWTDDYANLFSVLAWGKLR